MPKAQLNLTKVYMRGYKVKKNEKKAFQWATLAADQGIPEAQLYLGNMYIEGRGTRINTKKGREFNSRSKKPRLCESK